MRSPMSFHEAYPTLSTRVLVDDDIREFVVDELRNIDFTHITVDENDDVTKEALATLTSLHSSCSHLEFKVNQEIFGKNPNEAFKRLVYVWMNRFIDSMCARMHSFLRKHRISSDSSDAGLIFKLTDIIHNMTYDDYFKALEKLIAEDEKLAKECDQYCPSVVIPTLRNVFPSLVTEEEIVSAISEFKIPEMWCSNTAKKGDK